METVFIEATQGIEGGFNWGKFMVGRFSDEEWTRLPSLVVKGTSCGPTLWATGLLSQRGWTPHHLLVLDLETGEGAIFFPGGSPSADLEKHRVWVCPMFEPFLSWLYEQDLSDLGALPSLVELPDAPALMSGHRRPGPGAHVLDDGLGPEMRYGERKT